MSFDSIMFLLFMFLVIGVTVFKLRSEKSESGPGSLDMVLIFRSLAIPLARRCTTIHRTMLGAMVELPTMEDLATAATADLTWAAGITKDCFQMYGTRITDA